MPKYANSLAFAVLATIAAASSARADMFGYSGGIVTFDVTVSGIYQITVAGAQAGSGGGGGSSFVVESGNVPLAVARGGGGGSYLDAAFTGASLAGGKHTGDGFVDITPTFAATPEPGSVLLFGTVIAGLAVRRRLGYKVRDNAR